MCILNTNDAAFWWVALYFIFGVLIGLTLQSMREKTPVPMVVLICVLWPIPFMMAMWQIVQENRKS